MWEELGELMLGLVGAGIALAALYFFISRVQPDQAAEEEEKRNMPEHEALTLGEIEAPPAEKPEYASGSAPSVVAIYICAEAGAAMQRVPAVDAVADRGLDGDRYFFNQGHWSESDECEVTLVAQEDLDQATRETGISLSDGRHRRNIVTRNTDLNSLIGQRFRVGDALFSAGRPRPPCLYLQKLTEPGLARALVGRSGIGVHCFKSGPIREGDRIEILDLSLRTLLRRRWQAGKTEDDDRTRTRR